jgi:hypothetical protein
MSNNYCIEPTGGNKYTTFTPLWPCSDLGQPQTEFCCGYANSDSCCPSKFTLSGTGWAFKPGDDQRVENIKEAAIASYTSTNVISTTAIASYTSASVISTTAVATSSSSTSTSTSASPDNNSDIGTKVGLAVGIPLGVLAAGILGWLFYREKSKGKNTAGVVQTRGNGMDEQITFVDNQYADNQYAVANGYGQKGQWTNLVHEAPNTTDAVELRS